jgi:lipoate-protein ligase A
LLLYREKTTPLHTFAPAVSWEDVALAFREGFGQELKAVFVPGELSQPEWEMAHHLVQEKYSRVTLQGQR